MECSFRCHFLCLPMNSLRNIDLFDITRRQEQILKECEEWTQVFIDGLRDDEVFYDASFDVENESFERESHKTNVFDYEEIKERCGDRLGVYRSLLPFQAQQSNTGDCWLISALMALAQNPSAIKRIIPEGSYSLKHGIFLVRLFKEGEPHIVVLDGHFPIRHPPYYQFRYGLRGDMWAGLIEKAVAKEYGGYEKLHGGDDLKAFQMLTGAPCVNYYMDEEVKNVNAFWEKLVEFRSQNFPMTASGKAKFVNPETYQGDGHHAYSILDVCVREGNRLILIGNALAARKGKYEAIPKLTKEQLDTIDDSHLKENREKSLSWIDVEEMIEFFHMLTVCRYRDGWYEKKTPINDKVYEHLRIHVGQPCQMAIERTHTGLPDSHIGFLNIHKASTENGQVGELVASFQSEQLLHRPCVETDPFHLEPGDYIIVYVNAVSRIFRGTGEHFWVFRSPTPVDHISVGSDCHSHRWGASIRIGENSLIEMMKGRIGKEVRKGVILRDYSIGNVVVVVAENKTEKKVGIDIVAKSEDLIYSWAIKYVSPSDDTDFCDSKRFQIPAQSSKVLGYITRRYALESRENPKFQCLYKIRVQKAWWS